MELRPETLAFYVGIMVGVIGNFLVSCSVEIAKGVFEKAPSHVIGYWGFMFILSSTGFLQLTKWAMNRLVTPTPRAFSRYFDIGTLILIGAGIVVLVYALA